MPEDSTTTLLILGGLIVAVVCQIFWDRAEGGFGEKLRNYWLVYILALMSTGAFGLGLALYLEERGVATKHWEKRTRELLVGILSDPDYMRQYLTRDKIDTLFLAAAEARSQSPLTEEGGYRAAIREMMEAIPSHKPLRDGYRVLIDHELDTVNGIPVIRATVKDEFVLVNPTTEPMEWVQPVGLELDFIKGIDGKKVIVEAPMFVANDSVYFLKPSFGKKSVSYSERFHLRIALRETMSFRYAALLPLGDIALRRYLLPTKHVRIEYSKPKSFHPELYLFGLKKGGKVEPTDTMPQRYSWDLPELAVPGQGFFLKWTIRPLKRQ